MLNASATVSKEQGSSFRGALRASSVMAFAGLGDALLYPVLPVYGKDLGFSVFFIGVLLSINRFVRILANTAMANLIYKIGMRKILLISSIIAAITTFIYGLELGLLAFIVARILWGLSYSGLKISTLSYASKANQKSALAFGLSQSIKSLGALFVLWFGPIVIGAFGIQNGLFIIASISLIGIPFAYFAPKIPIVTSAAKVKSRTTFYPSALNLLVLILSISIDGILVVNLANLLTSATITSSELLVVVAFYLLVKRLFVVLISLVGGMLSLRYSTSRLFSFAVIGCLIAMLLITFNISIAGIILAFLCNTIVVTFSPFIAIEKEKNALQAISIVSTWWDLGAAIGALIGIYAFETIGMFSLFLSLFTITSILFINYYIKNAKPSRSII